MSDPISRERGVVVKDDCGQLFQLQEKVVGGVVLTFLATLYSRILLFRELGIWLKPVSTKNYIELPIQDFYGLDVCLIVRSKHLRDFERSLDTSSVKTDKPLTQRERNTLLTIIAALCKYESIDPNARGSATEITRMTDDLGAHVDDGTVRSLLAQIPSALETRKK
jgi:hypothetical protein